MPIDPNIIAGLRPVQIQQQDPMEQYGKSLALRNLMQQGDMHGLQYEKAQRDASAEKRIAALFADNPQATPEQVMAIDPTKGATFKKLFLEGEAHRTTIDKNKQEITLKETAAHRDELANVNDAQTAAQWVASGYQNPVLAPILSRSGSLQDALARIPQDPQAFDQWKKQNALGATKFIEMNKPHVQTQDLGGTSQVIATPGLGGAPTVLSSTPKTQTPDSAATDVRAGQSLAETKRHHAAIEGDPTTIETTAQAIAKGDLAPLSGFALGRPMGQQIMSRVTAINPEFNPTAFATRQRVENAFANGKEAQSVRSFNVGLSHLGTLGQLADALNNGNVPLINQAANAYAKQSGNAAPVKFEAAKQIVGDEIVKAIVGAGGGVGDREKAQKTIDAANTPAQLKGVIDTYKELMRGQLGGLKQQYTAGGGRKDFDKEFLSEDARAVAHSPAQAPVAAAGKPGGIKFLGFE